MRKRTDNTVKIFQTSKKAQLITLPKERVRDDLGWLVGDELEYTVSDKTLVLRRRARQ